MAPKPIKISQLNNYIGKILSTDPVLRNISIIGEISNLKFHSSGHIYFSLKDQTSKINCFCGYSNAQNLRYELEEGMEIIALGNIQVYEKGGYYSINIIDISLNGDGSLNLAFEKLKEKLEREGLFHEGNKQPIPYLPKNIGVITAETGAALQDIIKTITKNNKFSDILIFPSLVQGETAGKEIAGKIEYVNTYHKEVEVLIVGRGGGAKEELWAFNEEIVARAISASRIPIISAVGHETDFTIADFVADVRAETPTAAANLVAPNTQLLLEDIRYHGKTLKEGIINTVEKKNKMVEQRSLEEFKRRINTLIDLRTEESGNSIKHMEYRLDTLIKSYQSRTKIAHTVVTSLSPRAIMEKGYSIVKNSTGKVLKSIKEISVEEEIEVMFVDGQALAKVKKRGDNYGK